ncbi:MAG: VWA domain-containing protein [Myxococcales bacterium]|nr:VWA domain-containing protein [Myxococcales bacterium]
MTTRHLSIALFVACVLLLVASQARAAGGSCGGEPAEVMIVLDRSGSMAELAGNQSKWKSAQAAVGQLLGTFGSQLKMGMMLLPQFPDVDACASGKVNIAPSLNTKGSIGSLLAGSFPKGNTPLAGSLDAALAHLKTKTWTKAPAVILVTDGKETCRSPDAPLAAGGSCQWNGGSNYRKCGGCGWQFCLKSGTWSGACEPAPTIFPCAAGQTCGGNALCSGPKASGSDTPQQAAKKLAALGIDTYVVGFGAEIDAAALTAIAKAGNTSNYHQADNLAQLTTALNTIAKKISCCGNGAIDQGELCDPNIAAGQPGACPSAASCDDNDPCTTDKVDGAECNIKCTHAPITTAVNGDGCCPTGATTATDSDCTPSCGNGVVDPGESCDPAIAAGKPGACDKDCDDGNPCTVDKLGGSACNPTCIHENAPPALDVADGCCPTGLTFEQDADCLPPCTPDRTTNCVDMCQKMTCPDGHFCKFGKCEPWPQDDSPESQYIGGGCDCRTGGDKSASALSMLAMLLLFAPVVLVGRLRRARRRSGHRA